MFVKLYPCITIKKVLYNLYQCKNNIVVTNFIIKLLTKNKKCITNH